MTDGETLINHLLLLQQQRTAPQTRYNSSRPVKKKKEKKDGFVLIRLNPPCPAFRFVYTLSRESRERASG